MKKSKYITPKVAEQGKLREQRWKELKQTMSRQFSSEQPKRQKPKPAVSLPPPNEVDLFLQSIGLQQHSQLMKQHGIDDLQIVAELTETHLQQIGVPLGHRIKIIKRIKEKSNPVPEEKKNLRVQSEQRKLRQPDISSIQKIQKVFPKPPMPVKPQGILKVTKPPIHPPCQANLLTVNSAPAQSEEESTIKISDLLNQKPIQPTQIKWEKFTTNYQQYVPSNEILSNSRPNSASSRQGSSKALTRQTSASNRQENLTSIEFKGW